MMLEELKKLSSFRKWRARAMGAWPAFLAKRRERLIQQERYGAIPEKAAENILEDLFTVVLDWDIGDLNNQVDYADLVLTKLGLKRLLVEVKRPGSLSWNRSSMERALSQARGYAESQRVKTIAVSDGMLFYAVDIVHGGLHRRALIHFDTEAPPLDLWWVSVDGIYRDCTALEAPAPERPPDRYGAGRDHGSSAGEAEKRLLHPKYNVPVECFGYSESAVDPRTWKLPYRFADGSVDEKHLSGAVRAVISNYRGVRVSIPEQAIPDVLVRLGVAAAEAGKLPGQTPKPGKTYQQLYEVLHQLDRLVEVLPHK